MGSCAALGIDTSRCVALDHPDLQDNPKVWWEEAKIKPILKEYIEKWDIDAVSDASKGPERPYSQLTMLENRSSLLMKAVCRATLTTEPSALRSSKCFAISNLPRYHS